RFIVASWSRPWTDQGACSYNTCSGGVRSPSTHCIVPSHPYSLGRSFRAFNTHRVRRPEPLRDGAMLSIQIANEKSMQARVPGALRLRPASRLGEGRPVWLLTPRARGSPSWLRSHLHCAPFPVCHALARLCRPPLSTARSQRQDIGDLVVMTPALRLPAYVGLTAPQCAALIVRARIPI